MDRGGICSKVSRIIIRERKREKRKFSILGLQFERAE